MTVNTIERRVQSTLWKPRIVAILEAAFVDIVAEVAFPRNQGASLLCPERDGFSDGLVVQLFVRLKVFKAWRRRCLPTGISAGLFTQTTMNLTHPNRSSGTGSTSTCFEAAAPVSPMVARQVSIGLLALSG